MVDTENKLGFIDLMSTHNHSEDSNFRLKDCIIRAEDIVNRAIELSYKGVCITDHESVSAHVRILQRYLFLKNLKQKYNQYIEKNELEEIEKNKDIQKNLKLIEKMPNDFKLGLGNEIYLIDNIEDVTDNYESGVTKYWHFILIAKNKKGHQQLKDISSNSAWKNWFRQGGMERVPTIKSELEEIIGEEKGNLIVSTACLGGELANLVLQYYRDGNTEAKAKIHKFITWGINTFGKENFFIELQPTLEVPQEDICDTHPQIIFNQNAIKIAKAYGLNCVVTTDSHYLKKEHRKVHESYLKADDDNISNRELGDFYSTTYMMEVEEIVNLLSSHLSVDEIKLCFEGTMKIHGMIEEYDLYHPVIVPRDKNIPKFEIMNLFKDWYKECPYIKLFAESKDIQEQYFLYKCEEGFIKKKQELNNENIKRINIEMEEVWESSEKINMRIAPYYILVETLVNKIMWSISYVGIARGSVTGFYTAYLMDITQMNPLKYNLPHWRHLSKERPELPDIDLDSEASKRQQIFQLMKEYYGVNNVLNILTLKTEGSKSTIQTACRGLGIDSDTSQAIADMIPFERGANWSLTDCFEGNIEKNRQPIREFINEVDKYENLKEVMLLIEGLVCGRSIHASGVYIFDNGYLPQNSRMKAPSGSDITAWTMHDSDYAGGLKVDCLTIKALDKIHTNMDLLEKYKLIEKQPTIKETYTKYLHPDVLEYDDKEMWRMIAENSLVDAFQFDTDVGSIAGKKVKPTSLPELAVANSLMRLMGEQGQKQPIDTYIEYKNDIELWYKEMEDWGLSESEIKMLEPHLLPVCGVADTQEVVMRLTMDSKISNFNVAESNKMRKAIAKKDPKILKDVQELFYKKANEVGTRNELIQYVWEVQIKRQLGYSFSMNHTFPYSGICVQELNLAHRFDKIFWNTACLTVNAGADENNDNNKNTEYGKIAKAIGEIQSKGQMVALPHINKAQFSFSPDLDTHEIVFGLKGICGIGDNVASAIIANQPYTSFDDFLTKMKAYKDSEDENKFGDSCIITLIKSGAFDELMNKDRLEIMEFFIRKLSKPLVKLDLKHIPILKELNLLTDSQLGFELRLYNFRKYLYVNKFLDKQTGKSDNTKYYILDSQFAEPFFFKHFETNMVEDKDYEYKDDGKIIVKRGSLDREYDKLIEPFKKDLLSNTTMLKAVNEYKFKQTWEDKVSGSISKWEMDSLSFYYHEHELANIDTEGYMISNYIDMPQVPNVVEKYMYRGKEKPRFKLYRICGTVLDKDKAKHTVTILTTTGVVTVKFYKGQFGFYDKQISDILEGDTKKTVLEKSWFSRGTKLLVTGYRRGEQFIPKKYIDSAFRHTLQLIKEVTDNGELKLQTERVGMEEND